MDRVLVGEGTGASAAVRVCAGLAVRLTAGRERQAAARRSPKYKNCGSYGRRGGRRGALRRAAVPGPPVAADENRRLQRGCGDDERRRAAAGLTDEIWTGCWEGIGSRAMVRSS